MFYRVVVITLLLGATALEQGRENQLFTRDTNTYLYCLIGVTYALTLLYVFLLPRIVGLGKALDLCLTGRILEAPEALEVGEDWGVSKEVFPGVRIHFLYTDADEEFPSSIRVLFSGNSVREIRGEDLVVLTIACLNHMLT
jgi:hypothetical protein